MPSNNTPDFTAPVSSIGRNRFIGVAGNVYGGTSNGTNSAGTANANVGGVVYRGAGQSANQFPVSAASVEPGAPTGGAGQAGSIGSTNPLNVQQQVTSRKATENYTQSTSANVSGPGQGEIINFPKTTETADFGSSSSVKSNITLNREQTANSYVGITANKTFVVDDLTKLSEQRQDTIDSKENNKIDGAAKLGDPNAVYVTTQRESLPGGVDQSQKIG